MTADAVPPPPPPPTQPKGVIAIVTAPDGAVVAHAADFARDGYGGFKLWEAQVIRAERGAMYATLNAYAGPVLCRAITDYTADQIFGELRRRQGHRLTLRAIGWPDDVAREIADRHRR